MTEPSQGYQDIEQTKGEKKKNNLGVEQEIECPRCHDIMALYSDFDRLCYPCEECDFPLYLNK